MFLKEKTPETVGDIRQMLGLLNCFRRYIQDFGKMASPLFNLLHAPEDIKWQRESKDKNVLKKTTGQLSSKTKIKWEEIHQITLERLLDQLVQSPILAYPDYEKPFILHTDASLRGLGAILYQHQDDKLRVIAYASRTLSQAEKNYHLYSGKLEFLAVKWSISDAFRDYLYYTPNFTVYTDYNPLTYITTSAKLNATTQRWLNELSDVNFIIKYRLGKTNTDAGTMSRLPFDIERYIESCNQKISPEEIMVVMVGATNQRNNGETWIVTSNVLTILDTLETCLTTKDGILVSKKKIQQEQEADLAIGKIMKFLKTGETGEDNSPQVKALLKKKNRLTVGEDGILRRMVDNITQIVIPNSLKGMVFEQLHEEMGHLSTDRVYELARQRFYWPKMLEEIEHHVTKVCQCLKAKRPSRIFRAHIREITAASPFELVSIDFVHLEQSTRGYEYILVIIDNFTRFCQAYPTKNKSATTAAKHIFNDHDQGREFENQLFHGLENLSGIKRSRTPSYRPEGNGQTERLNRILLQMLSALPESRKSKWHESLNHVIHAYNCTRQESTGYSPYLLLFGRNARLTH